MPKHVRWQDGLLTVAGAYVLVTPWLFDFKATTDAAWTAWIIGSVIALLGLAGLTVPRFEITEWIQVLAGASLFVAPWVFAYDTVRDPAWNAWIAGPAAVLLAAWAIFDFRTQPRESRRRRSVTREPPENKVGDPKALPLGSALVPSQLERFVSRAGETQVRWIVCGDCRAFLHVADSVLLHMGRREMRACLENLKRLVEKGGRDPESSPATSTSESYVFAGLRNRLISSPRQRSR